MNKITNAIKIRAVYGKLFITGNLSFKLGAYLLLPSFMRPGISSVRYFGLYGHPLVAPDGEEGTVLVTLIQQIIGHNQYRVELIGKSGVVIDAGANMGIFSIFAAAKHPDATIYAFEPTPSTFATLKENTRYYPNIKIFNCGLGEKEKTSSIVIGKHSGANYIGEGGTPVAIKTIDGFGLPVSFIKMDTEGYEANILRGAAATIKKHRPIMVMSAYHKPGDETELPALIQSMTPYHCELRNDCEKDLVCWPI